MGKRFFTTTEVAKIMGISRIAVFKKVKSGEIKAKKVGRNFVIDKKILPAILGQVLSEDKKQFIKRAVEKIVHEYGQALKLLGKE